MSRADWNNNLNEINRTIHEIDWRSLDRIVQGAIELPNLFIELNESKKDQEELYDILECITGLSFPPLSVNALTYPVIKLLDLSSDGIESEVVSIISEVSILIERYLQRLDFYPRKLSNNNIFFGETRHLENLNNSLELCANLAKKYAAIGVRGDTIRSYYKLAWLLRNSGRFKQGLRKYIIELIKTPYVVGEDRIEVLRSVRNFEFHNDISELFNIHIPLEKFLHDLTISHHKLDVSKEISHNIINYLYKSASDKTLTTDFCADSSTSLLSIDRMDNMTFNFILRESRDFSQITSSVLYALFENGSTQTEYLDKIYAEQQNILENNSEKWGNTALEWMLRRYIKQGIIGIEDLPQKLQRLRLTD